MINPVFPASLIALMLIMGYVVFLAAALDSSLMPATGIMSMGWLSKVAGKAQKADRDTLPPRRRTQPQLPPPADCDHLDVGGGTAFRYQGRGKYGEDIIICSKCRKEERYLPS